MVELNIVWKGLSVIQRRILLVILNQDASITVEDLAEELDTSSRTIRTQLNFIEEAIGKTSLKIQRKNGVGVSLLVTEPEDLKFLQIQSTIPQKAYLDDRKIYLAQKLLLAPKNALSETLLGQQLFVSRSSISNDLQLLSEWFQEYDLILVKRKNFGIYIEGSEISIRSALADLYLQNQQNEINTSKSNNYLHSNEKILQTMYPGFDSHFVEAAIESLEQQNNITLQENAHLSLWFAICTAIYRIRTGNKLSLDKDELNNLFLNRYSLDTKDMFNYLQESYSLKVSLDERLYLIMLIESYGIHRDIDIYPINIDQINDDNFKSFLNDVVHTIEMILDIDFSNAPDLYNHFSYHLACAVMRLKFGLRIKNVLLPEIKISYPSVMGATWACSVLFEKYYNVKVTEDEIGFLALYVGTFAYRMHQYVRVCVVCNYGVGVTGLLSESLKSAIPNLMIIDELPSGQYKKLRALGRNNWDILITPLDINEKELPVVKVSTILTAYDLKRIKLKIREQIFRDSPDKQIISPIETHLFKKELVLLDVDAVDKNEAIKFACDNLLKNGFVTERFMESVISRERKVSTEVGRGIAIPHGNPQFVRNPAISVIRFKRSILWGNNQKVNLLFVLALRMESKGGEIISAKRFYKKLAYLLDNDEECKLIGKINDEDEFCKYFNVM